MNGHSMCYIFLITSCSAQKQNSNPNSLSPDNQTMESTKASQSHESGLTLKETELTLGLPGDSRVPKLQIGGTKRGFSCGDDDHSDTEVTSAAGKPPVSKWVSLISIDENALAYKIKYVFWYLLHVRIYGIVEHKWLDGHLWDHPGGKLWRRCVRTLRWL